MADSKLPRAVLFDAAGTLLYPVPPVVEVYARVASQWGYAAAPADVATRYHAAWSRRHACTAHNDGRTSEDDERAWWRALVEEVFPHAAAIDHIFAALWEHFAQPAHWQLFDDVPSAIASLQSAGIPWYIASNFDARLESICRGQPGLAGCAGLFISSRIGFRKPAAGFFLTVQQALGCEPGELLLIGDDLECDYLAARRCGWRALLVDRGGCRQEAESMTRLDELAEILLGR